MKTTFFQRTLCVLLSIALVLAYVPASTLRAKAAETDNVVTVADPETLTRPQTIYGDNTINAGKITVGKSVSDTPVTVNGTTIPIDGQNNFLVTVSQSAQVMGMTSEIKVPLDVVIVFDTSGSMGNDSNANGKNRTQELVTAANKMIETLMNANELNRVGVVAFSAHNAGGGTAGYNAANVLSELAHYTGVAATEHLTWTTGNGPSWAPTVQLVRGRSTTGGTTNSRYGTGGATNIQAGVTLGAQLLMEADTTVEINGEQITRTPILILMSDGAPTVSAYENQWWNASQTNNQGPTNAPFMGNGFLTVLTASYFKNEITRHYYGTNPGENACSIYTVGVELSDTATQRTIEEVELSYMTLNPTEEFVAGSDNYYYDRADAADSFLDAWTSYQNNQAFKVRVWSGQTRHDGYYYFYNQTQTIQNANDYKNGADNWTTVGRTTVQPNILSSVTTLHYNDKFYDVEDVSQLNDALDDMLTEIARKAVTVPTKVTTGDHNFDGYVNFYDPIGEYMEVKDLKGILADGYFYQGASFAQNISNYGTGSANAQFDALLRTVLKTRMNLSSADDRFASEAQLNAFIDSVLTAARNSPNQANYISPNNFDNSIVWWGNAYDSGEEDHHVQLIGFADNDTIEYIEAQRDAANIPEGADYVCRSYFFYGEAGGDNPNPDHQYLYFMVRVQRELTFPYRQTVVVSAPASLLSMEKVMISESYDENGNQIYTASVEHEEPARVVYEVGLWDTITAENVAMVVAPEYAAETVNGSGSRNYDAETDTYRFFTNDWDRSQSLASHHRGMAKATFDAAADNGFYTYQQDTLLVDANGKPLTANPAGGSAYYVRTYYAWPADANQDGTYSAEKKTVLIEVDIPAGSALIQKDGQWYIPAGAYTAATLVVNGDDTLKTSNNTGTSSIVAHPHRTGDASNSHYTVYLGNNGMLSLQAVTYEPVKTVSVNLPTDAVQIVDDEGKAVQVGDVLTYTVEIKNLMPEAADITVTDYVPMGTVFIEGSAGSGTAPTGHTADPTITPDSNNVLTWVLKNVPAGQTRYVSFRVAVTNAALNLNVVPGSIENTANVQIGNNPTVKTNTTHNPPYGKSVTDTNGQDIDGDHGFKVGDTLVYHIRFHNNAMDENGNFVPADVTVTDKIPDGTTFVSADNGGTFADGVVTWKFEDMAADSAKVVSFQVVINASAKVQGTAQTDGIEPAEGEIYLPNTATIVVDNDPVITLITNTTENWADVGDMVISKLVAGGDTTKTFTIHLTESTGLLAGKYPMTGSDETYVEFAGGKGAVQIKHGQTLTIQGLPAGVIITVEEDVSQLPGWTPTYSKRSVTITKGAATTISSVSVTNTYTLQPLTVTVKGVKTLSGVQPPKEITFGFVAVPDSGNPEVGDPLTGEVVATSTGDYTFTMSPKVFTKPGVYKYTISEINGGVQGVTYDTTQYTLVITVTDNGDGTMSAEAALDGAPFDLAQDAVSFTNHYTPDRTQLVLTADKSLSGRKLIPGEFRFQLSDGTNTYLGINDADGNIIFETITYTQAGTYAYILQEIVPDTKAEGVTYDDTAHRVVVTVTDENGQLVPTVMVNDLAVTVSNGVANTGITFRNSFEPNDVPLTLIAQKTLMVYDASSGQYVVENPKAGEFRFRIVEKNGTEAVTTGSNGADGTVVFNTFYFSADMLKDVAADGNGTKTKVFTYVISEIVPELAKNPNMRYDLDGREIEVVLTYTAEGVLTVSVNGDTDGNVDLTDTVNFINYQNPSSVSVKPEGSKTTKGENLPAGLRFSFTVVPVNGTGAAATGTSGATQGGGDSETTGITFTSMVYTLESLGDENSKTFSYWIMESNAEAGDNGVTYDKTRYLYQVTLSRDEYGRLVASERYFALTSGGSATNPADYTVEVTDVGITFTNRYEAQTHITLTAGKSLTGRSPGLKANEFDFVLQRLDSTGRPITGSQITGTNNASGVVQFATMNYSSTMLDEAYKHTDGSFYFSYLMQEIKPEGVAVPGVTYDTAKYIVTIKVTQTEEGMTAELVNVSRAISGGDGTYAPGTEVSVFDANGSTGVIFYNTYTTVEGDTVKFQIKKTLEGRDLRAGEFDFQLYLNGTVVDIATNDADGIVTFTRQIPATATPGIYKMTIKEAAGTLAGVTYDGAEYTVYIKITDNGSGKINATVHLSEDGSALPEASGVVDLTGQIEFKNFYDAGDTTYTPKATKELTGRDQIAGEFSFTAQLMAQNGASVTDGTVYNGINAADGSIVFSTITYTDAGTYLYKISENPGNLKGVQYDRTVYYLLVTVTDDGNGILKATVGYYTDEACTAAVESAVFHNTYTPDDGSVHLIGDKELIGRNLQDKEFSFVVHKDNVQGAIVATGSNQADGTIVFSSFDITAEDMEGQTTKTFTYVIVESNNALPGVTYAEPVVVTVTVTDVDGVLMTQVHYPAGNSAKFVNTYVPAGTELPLVAFKSLEGKDLLDGEFTFQLTDAAGTVLQTVTNDGTVVSFENLTFDATDMDGQASKTFVYTVSEQAGNMAGMSYDGTVYTVTVTVTDDGKGNLTATAAYSIDGEAANLIQFVNRYAPPAIEVVLEGNKSIVDANGKPLDHSPAGFTFEVYDAEGNYVTEAVSTADGKIVFTGFRFTAAGEYRFLISEKATDRPGYTADSTVWCVHITVGYDPAKGILTNDNVFIHLAPAHHEELLAQFSETLSFVNVYDPADVALTLKGLKRLSGRDQREGEFTFYMVDQATGLRAAEARNHGNGQIAFHLNYTEPGTYRYTIYEEIPAEENKLGGVTYTNKTYEITVEVIDDGNGALKARIGTVTVTGSGTVDLTGTVIFNNTYDPGSVALQVEAWKHLDGRELNTGEFTFELVNNNDPEEIYTATNYASGQVVFDPITYTEAGVYEYTLREVPGTAGGVTYDDRVYHVTVTVTDDGVGNLTVTAQYVSSDGGVEAVPTFRNYYTPDPVTYTPEVKKIYEGGDMLPFDFELSGEGFETQTKQNDPEGNVTFDQLTFTSPGSYTFTITEIPNETLEDIKWDRNVYTLIVEIIDDGEGQLKLGTISITSDLGRTDLVFRNVHEDLITEKDVFLDGDLSVSIDGKTVQKGDILTYTVSYKNYTGIPVDVTITDVIPTYTAYVDGSADQGGVYADGMLTWTISGVAPDETVTVRFDVVVTDSEIVVENQAKVLEGENTYNTNIVTNPVEDDEVIKDVFHVAEPTISIDGETVAKGDILLYKVTYTNSNDFDANVIITDKIPLYTAYVDGSADHDGIYDDGMLTWNVHLEAGESITVSFQVEVTGSNITVVNQATALEGENELLTNIVTNPVPEDKVEKDVFHVAEPTVSIDGKTVQKGNILLYKVTYTNSIDAQADVTITDRIPQYTAYVDGSADHGGTYADGVLTWNVHLEAGESITVSFQVEVIGFNVTVVNQATALEGENELLTNIVTNPVPGDKVEKDVFHVAEPTVSIDGETVREGDILLYKITYTNSFDAPADVTITDKVPQYTTYVDGSADHGGTYADGVLTWNVHLEAGESVTVSFRVKVVKSNITVVNQATALEGSNELKTNVVKNPTKGTPEIPDTPQTGDSTNLPVLMGIMSFSALGLLAMMAVMLHDRKKKATQK